MPYTTRNSHLDEGVGDSATRVCEKCDVRKNIKEYPLYNRTMPDGVVLRGYGYRRTCKSCVYARQTVVRKSNPDYPLNEFKRHLRIQYDLTYDEFVNMLIAQDNKCAICNGELVFKDRKRKPNIDHDHSTGKVRSILCFTCNTALGKFQDSKVLLQSAIDYLTAHEVGDSVVPTT